MPNRLVLFAGLFFVLNVSEKCGTYNITHNGAAGDGKTINTAAIQNTIKKCRDSGGGVVLIPAGIFVKGTIRLFSNINLHLENGVVLK